MIDLSKPVVDNVAERDCLYSCKEPRGSLIVGIAGMVIGLIIIPVFMTFVETSTPINPDTFLLFMFNAFSEVLGYTPISRFYMFVLYFMFSFMSGMACVKPTKSLALPFTFIAISILGFFFLALFIIGIPINYTVFCFGLLYNMLAFAVTILFPSLLGSVATRLTLSKKSCFIKGSTPEKR